MRPLLRVLQYRNTGKCRHLYRFTEILRKFLPSGSQISNVLLDKELFVYLGLHIHFLHDITEYGQLFFVIKVNER